MWETNDLSMKLQKKKDDKNKRLSIGVSTKTINVFKLEKQFSLSFQHFIKKSQVVTFIGQK